MDTGTMTRRNAYIQDIARQLSKFLETGRAEDLIACLVAESNLPGPRPNHDLARAFADTVREYAAADEEDRQVLWNLCVELACVSPEDAPTDDPHEFLSFCGVCGIAAIGSVASAFTEIALAQLQEASLDPRWRVREAVALGVRELLAARPEETVAELEGWVESGSWLPMRAAAAGIAGSDLMAEPDLAEVALRLHRKILVRVYTATERQSEAFLALRKALGYTLSRVVAALPGIGFEYLRQLATLDDRDVRWIIRENLERDGLRRQYPETVQHIRAQLS
ncbi:hypothetical protein [Methanoculleus sp. 7T]|uniref:hypothetical protein n=1 Tax=Methanoculleus sp. 7T TaxID=2937282 RepID=UPI0020C02C17|nr:hypothetical protein [Methanoculleus sp. 7T]